MLPAQESTEQCWVMSVHVTYRCQQLHVHVRLYIKFRTLVTSTVVKDVGEFSKALTTFLL